MHNSAHVCCGESQMFLHFASPLEMFSVIHWEMNTQAHFILHTHISFVNSLFSGKCVTSHPVALYKKVIIICPCKAFYSLCCIAWSYLGKCIKAPQCSCFIYKVSH
jgi:hypothetical protein